MLGDSYADSPGWGCGHDRDGSLALAYYRQAISIDAMVHYHIGLSSHARHSGRVEEALRIANEGLRLHPTHRGIRRTRASILIDLGRVDEAEQMLREAIADGGRRGNDEMNFAAIDLKRGRLEAAAEGFRKAVPVGGHSRRFINIARYYVEAGLPGPALEYLEQIVRAEPACAQFLLTTQSSYWSSIRSSPQARKLLERYGR